MIPYLCPICKSPLLDQGKDAVCKNGHLFDRAKEGYFYLLPPKSNAPGDNAEMVRARRDFLDCGFYVPLARAITDEINALFQRPVTLFWTQGAERDFICPKSSKKDKMTRTFMRQSTYPKMP